MEAKNPIKKRKYSRKGCLECKRRKIKCDELQPACGHCIRIEHECCYPDLNAPKRPRKPRRPRGDNQPKFMDDNGAYSTQLNLIKDSYLNEVARNHDESSSVDISPASTTTPISLQSSINSLMQPQNHIPEPGPLPGLDVLSFDNIFDDANSLVNGLADFNVFESFSTQKNQSQSDSGPLKPFHSNIILNSNEDVNSFFNEKELDAYLKNPISGFQDIDIDSLWQTLPTNGSGSSDVSPNESRNKTNLDLIEQIIAKYQLSEIEIKYLKDITYTELIFYIYPFGTTVEDDKVIRILLEYMICFKYLTYAMIALAAACTYNKSNDIVHDRYSKKYIAICMKLLVKAFGELKNDKHFLKNIEGLVLTVIVIAMIFADVAFMELDSAAVSWTSHLQGAKDLLVKYNRLKIQEGNKTFVDTPGIVLAKLLFFNYDWLSKLAIPIDKLKDLPNDTAPLFLYTGQFRYSTNPQCYTALKKLGLLTPESPTSTGFNLYSSLTEEIVEAIEEIIRLIQRNDRATPPGAYGQASPYEMMNLMHLIDKAANHRVVPFTERSPQCLIPEDSPGHPDFPDKPGKIHLPLAAYDKYTDSNGNAIYYSSCDNAQQLHVLGLYLKVLTSPGLLYLPRRHPMIKESIKKALDLMFFLKPKTDIHYKPENVLIESPNYFLDKNLFGYKHIMTQLTFRICSDLTDDLDHFEKLELYFRGLLELSNGSALFALERLNQSRKVAMERNERRKASGKDNAADMFDESDHRYSVEAYPVY